MSNDLALGIKVKERLTALGIETPMRDGFTMHEDYPAAIRLGFHGIMELLGLDLKDDSLQDTPARIAKMYTKEIFYGLDYRNFPKCGIFKNKMKADEMVCVKNVLVRSVCEHHFVPFIGRAAVAYIPGDGIIGLSKINRIVEFFCRRPQVQERLTEQVSAAMQLILGTEDVAVVIEAEHFCVKLRGVQDPHSDTVTSKLSGKFRTVPELRNEFLQLSKIR